MTKFIIAFIAFFALCAGNTAFAAQPDHSFAKNVVTSPQQLADLVRKSLAADPTGHSPVKPDHCTASDQTACATPDDFLIAFQHEDPQGAPSRLTDLADFLGTLVLMEPESGEEYLSACLSETHKVVIDCESRAFHPGEKAWGNPKTHKIDLAQDCANPVGILSPPVIVPIENKDCVRIEYPSNKGDEIRVFGYGPKALNGVLPKSTCTALKQAGATRFHSRLPHDCPDICKGWEGIARVEQLLHEQVVVLADPQPSYIQQVDGTDVLRLPAVVANGQYEIRICRHAADGTTVYMSVGLRNVHYVDGVATVKASDWVVSSTAAPKQLDSQEQAAMDAASRH